MNSNYLSKTILKKIESNANKGSLESAYQLYEYYREGLYLEKDLNKSKFYFDMVCNLFKQKRIMIKDIDLYNFRSFNELSIILPENQLAVLVGNNGVGKTSVLDAISMSLSWLRNRILYDSGSGDSIDDLDISLGQDLTYSSILANFKFNEKVNAKLELVTPHKGSKYTNKRSLLKEITFIGNVYKAMNEFYEEFNMPLLAYYDITRSLEVNSKSVENYDETTPLKSESKFDGYDSSLKGRADFKTFYRWYKKLDDIEKHRESSSSDSLKDIEKLKLLTELYGSEDIAKLKLDELKSKTNTAEVETPKAQNIKFIKEIINKVVREFMNGFDNLAINVEPYLHMTIEKNNKKLNVLQLSQGEKSLLALVLDITRRLIILNPSLENPLDGCGIVLIDEFDLHLHPKWQRNSVSALTRVFKNCQFIITTHSPIIIGELKPSQILILYSTQEGNKVINPKQSYGLSSNEILNEVMNTDDDVSQLTRNSCVEEKLDVIFKLISEKLFLDASIKIDALEAELEGDIPELISAKLEIDLNS